MGAEAWGHPPSFRSAGGGEQAQGDEDQPDDQPESGNASAEEVEAGFVEVALGKRGLDRGWGHRRRIPAGDGLCSGGTLGARRARSFAAVLARPRVKHPSARRTPPDSLA